MADRPADVSLAIGRARAVLSTPLDPPGVRPLVRREERDATES